MPQVLVCNKCRYRIPYNGEWPDSCPRCEVDMALPEGDVIALPAFNSWNANTKANDKVYRDMEAASVERARQAASIAGVPEAEMSHLKITNLNDRRDSQIAAMNVDASAAAQRLGMANPQAGFNNMAGADYARTAQAAAPRAGIETHARLKRTMGLA
jgi:hypothetical protein